jgi:uncharacterized protein DUF3152
MRPPTRWYLIIPVVTVCALLAWAVPAALSAIRRSVVPEWAGPRRSTPPRPSVSPSRPRPADPTAGPGLFSYADEQGPVLGSAGRVEQFRVAVERGIPYPVGQFAAKVQAVLGDPRGWTAGGTLRLQEVPGNAPALFTIYLATRVTSTRMCAAGGLDTEGYTSCRLPGRVIINLDRWDLSVPEYVRAGVPLDIYRSYVINHETGHQFGYGHELCPGPGRPAPVMEQQTLGMHGCTANAWPYLNGRRYSGRPGQY